MDKQTAQKIVDAMPLVIGDEPSNEPGKPTAKDAETLAVDALTAVVGDWPHAARTALAGASFRDLALIIAWADELGRLSRQAQTDYETRERRAWREATATD